MTLETWEGPQTYVVVGTGPYAVPWPYLASSIQVSVVDAAGLHARLDPVDWSVTPAASDTRGDVALTSLAAQVHAGRTLVISRATPAEQGWEGTQGEREAGLARQLDHLTMVLQEAALAAGSSERALAAQLNAEIAAGQALMAALTAIGTPRLQTRQQALDARPLALVTYLIVGDLPYVRDAAGTALVTADGARWSPAGQPWVEHWGAVGDGVTDSSAAFQAAVNWVGDGVLRIGPGDFRIAQIECTKGTLFLAQNGSAQTTLSANGTLQVETRLIYNGPGGATSRMFRWQSAVPGEWLHGGGIVGQPVLSGNDLCHTLVEGRSTKWQTFDVTARQPKFAGVALNSGNGVLSSFCKVEIAFTMGVQNPSAHGVYLTGETNDAGCTQHRIKTSGLIENGNMVHAVGNVDNCHLHVHSAKTPAGTGYSIAFYNGALHHARNNLITYFCGDIFSDSGCFGNRVLGPSEGMSIWGTGQLHYDVQDYINGQRFATPAHPVADEYHVQPATMSLVGGATLGPLIGGIGVAINLPKSGNPGGGFNIQRRRWHTGTIEGVTLFYATSNAEAAASTIAFRVWLAELVPGEGFAGDLDVTLGVPVPTGANQMRSHYIPFVPAPSWRAGGMIACSILRASGAALDTATGAAQLLGAFVHYRAFGPDNSQAPRIPFPPFKDAI